MNDDKTFVIVFVQTGSSISLDLYAHHYALRSLIAMGYGGVRKLYLMPCDQLELYEKMVL